MCWFCTVIRFLGARGSAIDDLSVKQLRKVVNFVLTYDCAVTIGDCLEDLSVATESWEERTHHGQDEEVRTLLMRLSQRCEVISDASRRTEDLSDDIVPDSLSGTHSECQESNILPTRVKVVADSSLTSEPSLRVLGDQTQADASTVSGVTRSSRSRFNQRAVAPEALADQFKGEFV